MKMDYWILLTALVFFVLGSIFDSSALNFLGWVSLVAEVGYILIKTV
ncbi:hypothetical protein KA107_03080 [Candidatus Pacearchaeota archaeon]|nr:hypothetical protein [Candidatus Pacearchaeota archaeon]